MLVELNIQQCGLRRQNELDKVGGDFGLLFLTYLKITKKEEGLSRFYKKTLMGSKTKSDTRKINRLLTFMRFRKNIRQANA